MNKRRNFIKNVGLSTAAAVSSPLFGIVENNEEKSLTRQTVKLGKDIKLELLTKENYFAGIGEVSVDNTRLRNGSLPICCEIRSPEGIAVTQFNILEKTITAERIFLRMSAQVHTSGMMDWMVHTVRNRENLYGWATTPQEDKDTIITLQLLPVERTINNQVYKGFSYQYTFSSPNFKIYKILDKATWEINGQAVGNECWMRVNHDAPSIVAMKDTTSNYSTENYFPGIANPTPFQFLPLQTELQGFTFQAHQKGILATWPTQVSHVRSLIEKPYHQNSIYHFHQHCNDLSNEFTASPIEVLWLSQENNTEIERYNIYESLRSEIHAILHKQSGIKIERLCTYGMIEEWTEPDFDYYTDVILPKFIDKGIKRIFLPNHFQNAMNVWGLSNMCCNVDYKFSATTALKIKRFCDAAIKAGIRVDMWGNTAISTLTEMFQWREGKQKDIKFLPTKNTIAEVLQNAKDPFVRNPSNAIEADHYTPRFAVLNLRDKDVKDYWMQCWKDAYDSGIHGIFLDSSFNMTSDKFHFIQNTERFDKHKPNFFKGETFFRPEKQPPSAILSQYSAHIQLIKEMQDMGYSYCGEDLGVFGVHRHGPEIENILPCMPLWPECIINFNEDAVLKAGLVPIEVFFKGLAYRTVWTLLWDFNQQQLHLGIKDPKAFGLLKIFNQVNEYMHAREISDKENYVKYISADGNNTVWWVIKPTSIKLNQKQDIWELTSNQHFKTNLINAKPLQVFTTAKVD